MTASELVLGVGESEDECPLRAISQLAMALGGLMDMAPLVFKARCLEGSPLRCKS